MYGHRRIPICIECGNKEARHWRSNFCEDCIAKMLNDKLREEEKKVTKEMKKV